MVTAVSLHEPLPEETGHLSPKGGHELWLGQTAKEGLGVDSEDSRTLAIRQ